jgi:hypothetical protein
MQLTITSFGKDIWELIGKAVMRWHQALPVMMMKDEG